ncbi:hypothetical protein Ancab_002123 [Ancistrocladus abbreviatus]
MSCGFMAGLGDDILGLIFNWVSHPDDRNSISQVCKQWLRVEGFARISLRVRETDLLPKFLPRFPNLIRIETSTWITNQDIEFVVRTCPKLEVLNLNFQRRYGDHYDDESDEYLAFNDVDDVGLCSIAKGCARLSKVLLRNRKRVSDVGVISLVGNLRNLSCLNLTGCSQVTDQALKVIGEVGLIRILNLRGCSSITDEGLGCLVRGSVRKSLEKLDIADCDRVTDNGVCLLQHFCCLEELNLADCGPRITDSGGLAIANIRTLKRLNLSWLFNILDVTLIEVAKNCQSLVELVITGCEEITGDGIRVFAEHKSLETLVMASCFNVSIVDIKLLVFGCRSLRFIGLDRRLSSWMPLGLQESINSFCRLNWM